MAVTQSTINADINYLVTNVRICSSDRMIFTDIPSAFFRKKTGDGTPYRRLASQTAPIIPLIVSTRAVQPVATCRQTPYLHRPAVVTVTSLIVTSFATELGTPTVTDVRTLRTPYRV